MSTEETASAGAPAPVLAREDLLEPEDVADEYRGDLGTTYWPPDGKACRADYPGAGESCRLPEDHAGAHTNLWEVWEA